MKRLGLFIFIAMVIATLSCNSDKKVESGSIYIGQPIEDFISIFEQQYNLEKGAIYLEGSPYDAYHVFENDEDMFAVELLYPDYPPYVYRIWIYSPQIKTEKGIGVGSTYGEMKSMYNISSVSNVIGTHVWIEELSATFIMTVDFQPDFDWGRLDIETMPESATIQAIMLWSDDVILTTDKRIIARNTFETADAIVLTTETATGVMTMTTVSDWVSISIGGSGTVTIDWGDGSEVETGELIPTPDGFPPELNASWYQRLYPDASARNITIIGEDITFFACYQNQLTQLDVSQNTALQILICSENQLTSLDFSRNTELKYVKCIDNKFTAEALNALFTSLLGNESGEIFIDGNPGSAECDPAIAEVRGWTVSGFTGTRQYTPIQMDEFAYWFKMSKDDIIAFMDIAYSDEGYEIVYYTEDLLEGYFFESAGMTFMFDGIEVEWIIPPLEFFGVNENMIFEQIEAIYGPGTRDSYFMEQAGGDIYTLTYEAENHTIEFTSSSENGANPIIRCYKK